MRTEKKTLCPESSLKPAMPVRTRHRSKPVRGIARPRAIFAYKMIMNDHDAIRNSGNNLPKNI